MRNHRSFYYWPEKLGTFFEAESFKTTSQGIQENVSSSVKLKPLMQLAGASVSNEQVGSHSKI